MSSLDMKKQEILTTSLNDGGGGRADYQIKCQLFLNHCTKIQFSKAELTFKALIPLANQKSPFTTYIAVQ